MGGVKHAVIEQKTSPEGRQMYCGIGTTTHQLPLQLGFKPVTFNHQFGDWIMSFITLSQSG